MRGNSSGVIPAVQQRCRQRMAAAVLAVAAGLLPLSALPQELPARVPVRITADRLDYDRSADVYTAAGNVKVEYQDMRLEADRVMLNNRTGEAMAEGNVYLRENEDVLTAEALQVNINSRAGVITRGRIFRSKEHYHIEGKRIERRSETEYSVEDGSITTCDEGEWYLTARRIDVDMNRYATASGVSFNIAGVPVLYTPYFLFPVRRQTGLLIPEAGYNSKDGFLMKNFFYWAISDHTDATVTSDYRDKLGHGTGLEYRYVNSRDSSGEIVYTYFDQKNDPDSRWEFRFQHHEELAEDLSARADITLVSDDRYYRDLEKSLDLRSRPSVDSNAFYVERWNTSSLSLAGQYTTDLTGPNDNTIQTLPALRYTLFQERLIGPLHLTFDGSASNFTRKAGNDVRRADFNPELTVAAGTQGIGFAPRIGARATFYDRGETTNEPVDRTYWYGGADLNIKVSRVFGTDPPAGDGIGRIRHSVETGLSYRYGPEAEKTDIPRIDVVETQALTKTNVVAAAIVNRFTARYREGRTSRTYDMMVFTLSQSYDINAGRNGAPDAPSRSAITGEFFFKTPRRLTVSATGEYDTYIDRLTSTSESLAYQGEVVRLDLGYRYLRGTSTETVTTARAEYLTAGGGLKLSPVDVTAQVWRDLQNRNTTQQEYKVFYSSQCWGIGASYIKKPGEVQYLFGFELKGIGGLKP